MGDIENADHVTRFRRTIKRLIIETFNAPNVAAALGAMEDEYSANRFLQTAASAFQADLQIRLIRLLDTSGEAASFWYLYRCEPEKVANGIDLPAPRDFSERFKKIRDKVFVHIDRRAVFDPEGIYDEVDIKGYEIVNALETLWRVLNRLYEEYEGKNSDSVQRLLLIPYDTTLGVIFQS
jgi:hypothetical protein